MIERTLANLRKNNMDAYFVKTKAEVVPLVESLLHEGDVIANGGSQTLKETGVIALIQSPKYRYLDRNAPGLTPENIKEIFRQAFSADVYLCSANAITQDGELYNVDGNANRVAAMLYGPDSVIVIAGKNKIVKDLDEAIKRVKTVAAPKNTVRLGLETYCSKQGKCVSLTKENPSMCDGCASGGRICCSYTVMGMQRNKGRVKVILVDEPLGF